MATYYARNTGGNWNSSSSWSTVSSASSTNAGTFPGSADITILDSGSGNITINVASNCLTLTTTGYTGTLTFNNNLITNGNVTFSATTTIATDVATRRLQFGTGTITTNGIYLPITISVTLTTSTITLADDLDCLNTSNFYGIIVSSSTTTKIFKIRGNLTFNNNVSTSNTNLVVFRLTGTGTISGLSGGTLQAPLEINTAGTITFSTGTTTLFSVGNATSYSNHFNYVTGTVITTNSIVQFTGSGTTYKINSSTLTFDTVYLIFNVQLQSTLNANTISFPTQAAGANTLSGSFGFICNNLDLNKIGVSTYRPLTLTFGNTYVVNKLISTPSIPTAGSSITSSSGTSKVVLTLNGGSNLIRCALTRVDASGGVLINTIGAITNCSNVGTSTQNVLI